MKALYLLLVTLLEFVLFLDPTHSCTGGQNLGTLAQILGSVSSAIMCISLFGARQSRDGAQDQENALMSPNLSALRVTICTEPSRVHPPPPLEFTEIS